MARKDGTAMTDKPTDDLLAEDVGCPDCITWIKNRPVPEKVIILRCTQCSTEYMLYPNGQIGYETHFTRSNV